MSENKRAMMREVREENKAGPDCVRCRSQKRLDVILSEKQSHMVGLE